jgi:type II secretory pathway pseudopilin PulG
MTSLRAASRRPPGRRRGFTITEMLITGVLMSLFGVLLGQAWASFGRPAIVNTARCRVAQEANLAAEALARDVGLLAVPADAQVDSRYANAQALGSTLYMTIDDGSGVFRTIAYAADASDPTRLVRTDLSAPANSSAGTRVVAGLLAGFHAQADVLAGGGPGGRDATGVRIDLTFTHRSFDRDPDGAYRGDYTRRFTLFIPDPQS